MITASHYCSVLSIKSLVNKHCWVQGVSGGYLFFSARLHFLELLPFLYTSMPQTVLECEQNMFWNMCSLHIHPFLYLPMIKYTLSLNASFAAFRERNKMLKSDGTRVIPIISHLLLQAEFHTVF